MEHIRETLARNQELRQSRNQRTIPTPISGDTETSRQRILRDLRLSEPLKTFGNFKVVPSTEHIVKAFKTVADGDKSLLLCVGSSGCGKTHLLKSAVLRLYGRGIFCRYMEWHRIINTFKAGLDKGAIPPYEDILENYCQARALAIDDYGLGSTNTQWEQSQLETIINYRYDRQLITMVTTNLRNEELPERVVSRFRDPDVSIIVVNRASDYRRRKV